VNEPEGHDLEGFLDLRMALFMKISIGLDPFGADGLYFSKLSKACRI